jgi:ParB family chromosome partitioning protein
MRAAYEAAEAKLAEIDGRIAALAVYDPDDVAIAGCYVTISQDGSLRVQKGLVRKQDLKLLAKADGKEQKPKGMPSTLKRDLEAIRLQVAQAEIAKHRLVAFDLLVFAVARAALRVAYCKGIDVRFTAHDARVKDDTTAANALKSNAESLPTAWLKPKSEAEQFRAFTSLSEAQKLDLLAWCVAGSLTPQLSTGHEATAVEIALTLTGGEAASYWRPTAATYLGRITRDQLLALGKDLLGERWAQARHKDKKSSLAAELERAFADPAKVARTPEQLHRLTNWLPDGMAFAALAAPAKAAKTAKKAA